MTLRIWDANTGQPIGTPLIGHTDAVTSVAFSPDGRRILSGSIDKTSANVGREYRAADRHPFYQPLLQSMITVAPTLPAHARLSRNPRVQGTGSAKVFGGGVCAAGATPVATQKVEQATGVRLNPRSVEEL